MCGPAVGRVEEADQNRSLSGTEIKFFEPPEKFKYAHGDDNTAQES